MCHSQLHQLIASHPYGYALNTNLINFRSKPNKWLILLQIWPKCLSIYPENSWKYLLLYIKYRFFSLNDAHTCYTRGHKQNSLTATLSPHPTWNQINRTNVSCMFYAIINIHEAKLCSQSRPTNSSASVITYIRTACVFAASRKITTHTPESIDLISCWNSGHAEYNRQQRTTSTL